VLCTQGHATTDRAYRKALALAHKLTFDAMNNLAPALASKSIGTARSTFTSRPRSRPKASDVRAHYASALQNAAARRRIAAYRQGVVADIPKDRNAWFELGHLLCNTAKESSNEPLQPAEEPSTKA